MQVRYRHHYHRRDEPCHITCSGWRPELEIETWAEGRSRRRGLARMLVRAALPRRWRR